ncbi:MAG: hypothetical protein IPM81_07185 [Saprospirales bacterium]|nr:hypothetical protein [Saprospirales bacterium]
MQRLLFLLVLALFLSVCQKEPAPPPWPPLPLPDLGYVVRGRVVDIVGQEPVPGVALFVEQQYLACFWCIPARKEMGHDTTDTAGRFEMRIQLPDEKERMNDFYLKFRDMPAGFQQGAAVNGATAFCMNYAGLNYLANWGCGVTDEGYYKIELRPYTWARFVRPVLPPGWATDTLVLKTTNLFLPDCAPPYLWDPCLVPYLPCETAFPMTDADRWHALALPTALISGNQTTVTYTVRNGAVKKTGSFTVDCVYGDTTEIYLPLER